MTSRVCTTQRGRARFIAEEKTAQILLFSFIIFAPYPRIISRRRRLLSLLRFSVRLILTAACIFLHSFIILLAICAAAGINQDITADKFGLNWLRRFFHSLLAVCYYDDMEKNLIIIYIYIHTHAVFHNS